MSSVLEDRLHQSILRTNQIAFDSCQLKEENELLEKEQVIFSATRAKLQNDLQVITDYNGKIATEAAANNSLADSAMKQMSNLESQINRERDEFKKELVELNRLVENDRKMREFLLQKQQLKKDLEASKPVAKVDVPRAVVMSDSDRVRLEFLSSFFEAIRSATGINSIDRLIGYFTEKEIVNYSLFTRLNLDREEAKKVNQLANSIRAQVYEIRATYSALSSRDQNSSSSLADDAFNTKIVVISKLLTSLRLVIQVIFKKLFPEIMDSNEYLSPSILASSAGSEGIRIGTVTDDNIVGYLAAIEKRVTELVVVCTSGETIGEQANRKKSICIVHGKMSQFKLPSSTEDADEDGEARDSNDHGPTRPFTRDELKSKTLQSIQKNQDKLKAKRANLKFIG